MDKTAVVERFCNRESNSHAHARSPELIVYRIVVPNLLCRRFTQPGIDNIEHPDDPGRDLGLLDEGLANGKRHRLDFDYIKFVTHDCLASHRASCWFAIISIGFRLTNHGGG